ncbi:MAG TPA: sporulation integral membrane protein YlbJ [Bacillota bacterium]|nr:sporulation integral membrane protein YlbJ [Bacillota bacterium]
MRQVILTILLASVAIFMAGALMRFPEESLNASLRGLELWWEIVFPSLLPFFITAELLIGFGVVKFIGVLFEPIMRPLFNVPGAGSFAWVMGMASGYPSGAKISARLREEKQLTKIEAERLVSFTNASSPLFVFGAVSVGFFNNAKLGIILALSHYIGNALVGVCMRFYGRGKEMKRHPLPTQRFSIARAFKEMHQTRLADPRQLGEIIGDAVLNSIQTLVMVGGFIILFSVLTKLFLLAGIMPMIAFVLQIGLKALSLPVELSEPLFTGLFEISLGARMISDVLTSSLMSKIVVVSFILGFNGFSVQAQVASILAKTDIHFAPYFFARFLHGAFASLITVILFKPLYQSQQVFKSTDISAAQSAFQTTFVNLFDMLKMIGPLFTILSLGIACLLIYRRKN